VILALSLGSSLRMVNGPYPSNLQIRINGRHAQPNTFVVLIDGDQISGSTRELEFC
jgi:hypothetical protein